MHHFRGIGIALIAFSMGFGSLAAAQERGHPDRHDRYPQRHLPSERIERNQPRDLRQDDRASRHRWRRLGDAHAGARVHEGHGERSETRDQRGDWRRASHTAEFRRGGRLPDHYRNRQYLVNDWRGHYLSEPPPGHHWVQTGGDYVLAAIATGVILQILLNN